MRVPRERTSRTPLSMILGLMAALLLCACGGGNGGAGATDATETAQSKGGTRGAPTSTTTTTTVTGSATATLAWSAPQTNADGSAMNLLSLARVNQALGEADVAHRDLERVLDGKAAPALRAEAAARKAQLYLATGELTDDLGRQRVDAELHDSEPCSGNLLHGRRGGGRQQQRKPAVTRSQ